MIDKSQRTDQVLPKFCQHVGYYDAMHTIDDPDVLVYAIGDCESCGGRGFGAGSEVLYEDDIEIGIGPCPTCNGSGKERVRVIPETTLRRLVQCVPFTLSAPQREALMDPLIAQLIEEWTP